MSDQQQIEVRPIQFFDRRQLANLIHSSSDIHRHLDWRRPVDWIGYEPYFVAEQQGLIVGALACPKLPHPSAWIRLFAVKNAIPKNLVWDALWEAVCRQFAFSSIEIGVIPMYTWFQQILESSGFEQITQVVTFIWENSAPPRIHTLDACHLRVMEYDDLDEVHRVDAAAFDPVWQIPGDLLKLALTQAALAIVAEDRGEIIGYHISTANSDSGHLARLAIDPLNQGRGVGTFLVQDMLAQFRSMGACRVTVNTQTDNTASLALYQKSGFQRTEEVYPVFRIKL